MLFAELVAFNNPRMCAAASVSCCARVYTQHKYCTLNRGRNFYVPCNLFQKLRSLVLGFWPRKTCIIIRTAHVECVLDLVSVRQVRLLTYWLYRVNCHSNIAPHPFINHRWVWTKAHWLPQFQKDLYSPHHKNKEKRHCNCDSIFWRVRVTSVTTERQQYVTLYCCWPTDNCQQNNIVQHCHGKATMNYKILLTIVNNINVFSSSCKVPYIFVRFQPILEFLCRFFFCRRPPYQISQKSFQWGATLISADRQADGQT